MGKSFEQATKAAGYMHRGEPEYIFGYSDRQTLYNAVFEVFYEHPIFLEKGEPKDKVIRFRALLESKLGMPVANTDHDMSGRILKLANLFMEGKIARQLEIIPGSSSLPVTAAISRSNLAQIIAALDAEVAASGTHQMNKVLISLHIERTKPLRVSYR